MKGLSKNCIRGLLLPVLLLLSVAVGFAAPIPTTNLDNLPATDFAGEQFCFDAPLSNNGAAGETGFGPYLRLELPPEISFDANDTTFLGSPVISNNLGSFPLPPNPPIITDPLTGEDITGTPGNTFITIQPPIGSVSPNGPPLLINICSSIDVNAPISEPLEVNLQPVLQFGDTATGENGPISSPVVSDNITPGIVKFEKRLDAPEGERPPGASWPVSYDLVADIANGKTIFDLVFSDILPLDLQYVANSISVTGGTGCTPTVSGQSISVSCTSALGTANEEDVVVTYQAYVKDVLDKLQCDAQTISNTANFNANRKDASNNDVALGPLTSTETMAASHVEMQKSVTPGVDPAIASPGDSLSYTVNIQVSDFGGLNNLVFSDVIPDGLEIPANFTMSVDAAAPVAINPTIGAPNANGSRNITFDIGAAIITGGITEIAAGSSIQLKYTADISQTYKETSLPVKASDELLNAAKIDYGLSAGASNCVDVSSATSIIKPISINKEIINPLPEYQPGDVVTFRLTMDIPSGDSSNIVFEDFFPLPVFEVAQLTPNPSFGAGQKIRHAPTDTLGIIPDTISIDTNTNKLIIDWPNVTAPGSRVLAVDIDMTVSSKPFADNLSLSNLFQASTDNTPATTVVNLGLALIKVGSPNLVISKGVASSDNTNSTIIPAPVSPNDSNLSDADASDTITYEITVENIGGAKAFDVIVTDDLGDPANLLENCSVASVVNGAGANLAHTEAAPFDGIINLTDPLAKNNDTPPGGGVPFTTDTAIIKISCKIAQAVEPAAVITNTSSATWASGSGENAFPAVEDDATVIIKNPDITKSLAAGSPSTFTIGDIIRYEIVITVPELTINSVVLNDALDSGLAFVDMTDPAHVNVTSSAGVTTSASAFTVTNSGSNLTLDLGTVTNTNTDNFVPETITVAYDVVVLNNTFANAGDTRNNAVNVTSTSYNSNTVRAANITLVEPHITVDKTVLTPGTSFDAGDVIEYEWHVRQTGSNLSNAFDVVLTDTLPSNVTYLPASLAVVGVCPNVSLDDLNPPTLKASWSTFAVADDCHVTYKVTLDTAVTAGSSINNVVDIAWTSLAGTVAGPISIYNPNSCERTSASDPNACGSGNDFDDTDDASISINRVAIKKLIVGTSLAPSITGVAEDRPGTTDLAIGETATFTITVTVPEGTSELIRVRDNLPAHANGVMEFVSVDSVTVGANLTTANNPAGNALDARLGDGILDRVIWNFGQVVNSATDGTVDDDDRIIITLTGRLVDVLPNNVSGKRTQNNSRLTFGTGLFGTSNVGLDIVEPKLQIDKSSATTTADGGDTVTFTILVNHLPGTGSTQEAFDVAISDLVPAGLIYNSASLDVSACLGSTTTQNNAAGFIITLDNLPQADSCSVTYTATVENTVNPNQVIDNVADLVWDSLPDDNIVNPLHERDYTASDNHQITVSTPGLSKIVFATSENSTGTSINGIETDLTIGETVTYHFTTTIPEGQTDGVIVTDQLPIAGVAFKVVSSKIVSIGSQMTLGAHAVNDSGDDCLPASCDTNSDTFRDKVQWNLGDIINTPDADPANDQIVFEVVAVVLDVAENAGGIDDDILNIASLAHDNDGGTPITGSVAVDLVQPDLELTKKATPVASPFFADAGDVITFELEIKHDQVASASTADAFNLHIEDTLANDGSNALMEWVGNVGGTCVGTTSDSSATAAMPFKVVFDVPTLSLADASCTITYQVRVATLAQPAQTLQNQAALRYDSTPVFVAGETRRLVDNAVAEVVISAPSLVKVVSSTNLDDTNLNKHDTSLEDLTIGEQVTYSITMKFPEGTAQNVILTDVMPTGASGIIEIIGTPVISIGNGNKITTTNATVTVNPGNFSIDFGTVTNVPDNVDTEADLITVTVTGVVVNQAVNEDARQPVNTATFTFTGGSPLTDTASVDLVEPAMSINKSMTVSNGIAIITVNLTNSGTASAYDIEIKDILDSANWDTTNISPVTVPAGFTLTTVAGPGGTETTVLMASDSGSSAPVNSIEPSEIVTFQFSVPIKPGIASIDNTATNTAATTLPGTDPNERDEPDISGNATLGIPLIELEKSAAALSDTNGDGEVGGVGDDITYNFTVKNTGAVPLSNITVTDNNPLVTVTGNPISLAVGATDNSIFGTYTITQDDINLGSIQNTASVTADGSAGTGSISDDSDDPADSANNDNNGDGEPDDPTIVSLTQIPSMAVSKTTPTASISAPGTISYTITVENDGNMTLTGVTLDDTLPDGSNGTLSGPTGDANNDGKLDVSEIWSYTISYAANQADIDAGTPLVNAISVTTTEIITAVTDSATTNVTQLPAMSVTKVADPTIITSPGIINYTITVKNDGNVTLTGVSLADILPDGNNGTLSAPTGDANNDGKLDITETWSYTTSYAATQANIDAGATLTNTVGVTTSEIPVAVTATADTSITQSAAMTLDKTVNPAVANVSAGQTISYSYLVTNTGKVTINSISISDVHSGTGSLSAINCPLTTLAPQASTTCTATYVVTQADIDAGANITNTATANGTPSGGTLIAPTDNESVTVATATPAMTIDKRVDANDKTDVVVGQTINYSYDVTNSGNVVINTISVSDVHSGTGSLSAINCPVTSLAPLGTTTCTATYIVTQEDIDAGVDITNEATANGVPIRGTLTPQTDNESIDVADAGPVLTILKTANVTSDVTVGQTITYSYLVKNDGNVTINNISVSDIHLGSGPAPVPSGGATTMLPGQSTTFTSSYIVTQADIDAGVAITNEATANGTPKTGTLTPLKDDESVDLADQLPKITLDKTATAPTIVLGVNPAIVDPDDTITYTLVTTNTGNVTLHNVIVSDSLLTLACGATSNGDAFNNDGSDTLDLGESVTCSATYALTQSDIDAGGRTNTATANATDPLNNPVSGSDTVGSPLDQKTSIELLKTATVPTLNKGLDNAQVDAGDTIDYTFDVKNTGNVTLANVTVTDQSLGLAPFNMAVDCGSGSNVLASLAANATLQCNATYTLTQDDIDGLNAPTITNNAGVIELANTADVTGTPPAGSGLTAPTAQSSATAEAQLTAAIAMVKTAGVIADKDADGVDSVGDEVTYTYVVTNKGVTTLTNVTVVEDGVSFTGNGILPSPANETSSNVSGLSSDASANDGVWDSLSPGDVVTFTAVYVLTQLDVDNGTISNTAKATGTPPAGLGTPEAQSSVIKPVTPNPKLTIVKTADNTLDVVVGQTLTYNYLLTNSGNVTIDNLVVSDVHNGTGTLSSISCPLNSLAPTDSTTCTATYVVTQADIDKSVNITNTATANGLPKGGSLTPASDGESVDVANPVPNLTIDKKADDTTDVIVGQVINYSYEVTNTGNVTIDSLTVNDVHQGSGLAPVPTGGATTLAPGASTFFNATYIVTQADIDAGVNITNIASANGVPKNGTLTPPTDNESVDVANPGPALIIDKKANDTSNVVAGQTITYSYLVVNTGNVTIDSILISDNHQGTGPAPIPAGGASSLAPGASTTFIATYVVTQADIDAGVNITNIATANGTPKSGTLTPATDDESVDPADQVPQITLDKSASAPTTALGDNPAIVDPGDTITYTLVTTNTGNVTLNSVIVSDPILAITAANCTPTSNGDTFNNDASDTLDLGESVTCTAVYTLTQSDIDAGGRDNTATANANDPGGNPLSGSDTVGSPLVQKTSIDLLKTASTPTLSKGLDDATVDADDTIDYIFDIKNTGNVTLTNVTVSDLSLGVAPFNMVVDCGAGSNIVASLAANATHQCTATYTLTLDDINGSNDPTITNNSGIIEVANTAQATGTPPANSGLTPPVSIASATANAQLTAAIALVKTAGAIDDKDGNGVDSVGDELTYTYVVTNKGVTTLSNVTIAEDAAAFTGTGILPSPGQETSSNVSGLSNDASANDGVWDSLSPGDIVTFTAIYALTQADIDSGNVGNSAKASGTPPQGMASPEAESSVLKPIHQKPTLTIVKNADEKLNVIAGQTITYSYVVTNTGNVTIDAVSVSDNHQGSGPAPVPVASDPIAADSLAPGESTAFTATYVVTQEDINAGINITNLATADGTPKGGSLTPPSDDESIDPVDAAPGLAIDKRVDADDLSNVVVGQIINYSYDVVNTGNITIDAISVSDVHLGSGPAPIPTGGATTLAPGESTTFTATYIITQVDVDAGISISNTATANGTPQIGVLIPPKDTLSIDPVNQAPAMTLVKVLSNNADEDSSNSITFGDTLTYTVTATNTGNITLSNVTVFDSKISPSSTNCASLALNASCQLVGTYKVIQTDVDAGKVDNTAGVTTPDVNNIPDVKISTPIVKSPNISLTKEMIENADEDGSNSITLDDTLTYKVIATNTGNTTLTNVTVSDTKISPNSKTCVSLALAASCELVGTYKVNQDDVDTGKIDNTGSASTPDVPNIPDVQVSTPINKQTSVNLDKVLTTNADEDASNSITLDDTLTYTVTATNTGNTTLANVTVSDSKITPNSKTCITLVPAASCKLVGTYKVAVADVNAGKIDNTANASTPDVPNIPDVTLTTVVPHVFDPPSAIKTVSSSGIIGMEWQMVWINTSIIAAPDVFVFDEIPLGTHFEAMPAGDNVSSSGVYCETRGASTTNNTFDNNCFFEAPNATYPRGRIVWKGTISSDPGLLTEETANNEVVIRFISVLDNPGLTDQVIENQGNSEWDYDHDGNSDINVPTDNPVTPDGDPDVTIYKPFRKIPTLSEWGLILLILMLLFEGNRKRRLFLRIKE